MQSLMQFGFSRAEDIVRSSVEREFTIIGEALAALNRLSEEIFGSITQARRIVPIY